MSRSVAFLRAVNVGGHTVKMDRLRQLFESIGFSRVETYLASGNVVFETSSKNVRALEKGIEKRLREELGYEVPAFIRTEAEIKNIANYEPFRQSDLKAAVALNIAFLSDTVDQESKQKVIALRTPIDHFQVHGREIYWLCRRKQSESTFTNVVLEKSLGRPSTLRGAKTVKEIAAKYFSSQS